MPFKRVAAMMRGQVDTGGTGRMATIATGMDQAEGGEAPKPLFGGLGVTVGDPDAAAVTVTDTGDDLVIVYHTMLDARVRPAHAALEGRTWDIDDPAAPAPPLGYGCRCHVEIVRRPAAVEKAPKTEAAALKKFPDLDKNVEQYMGKEIAALYRAGDLKTSDLLTETNDPITVPQARVIAAARRAGKTPTAGLTALAELNGMGLDDRTVVKIAKRAQELVDKGATAPEALRLVILSETRIGGLASRTASVREARIAKAVPRFQATGLLKYEPPPTGPALPEPPPREPSAPPAPIARPIPLATQPAQVAREGQPFRVPTAPDPHGVSPLAPLTLPVLDAAEAIIARRTTERLVAFDAGGRFLASTEGTTNSADVPIGLPADALVTHNHPSGQTFAEDNTRAWGSSLSGADLTVAAHYNMRAIRAVSPSGRVFEMARPASGWPKPQMVATALATIDRRIRAQLVHQVAMGVVAPDAAGAIHNHLINQAFAAMTGARYSWSTLQ